MVWNDKCGPARSELSYVLRTDAGFTGAVPLSPDDWMIHRQGTGLWRHHLPGVGAVILPALWRLHEDARKTPASVQERASGTARMFIMRTDCLASVDPGMADAMVAQAITNKIPQLQGLLLQHGILTLFDGKFIPYALVIRLRIFSPLPESRPESRSAA